jgi:methionine aminotransferase
MMQKFREVHRYQVYSVNLPMQLAIADYMNGIGNWNIFSDKFQKKRDLFAASMKESRFTLFPVQGGFFQILGYEQISQERDTDFCFRLAYEYGVTAFPLSPFYHDNIDNQRLRVCFGKDDSLLRIAAERLSKL